MVDIGLFAVNGFWVLVLGVLLMVFVTEIFNSRMVDVGLFALVLAVVFLAIGF